MNKKHLQITFIVLIVYIFIPTFSAYSHGREDLQTKYIQKDISANNFSIKDLKNFILGKENKNSGTIIKDQKIITGVLDIEHYDSILNNTTTDFYQIIPDDGTQKIVLKTEDKISEDDNGRHVVATGTYSSDTFMGNISFDAPTQTDEQNNLNVLSPKVDNLVADKLSIGIVLVRYSNSKPEPFSAATAKDIILDGQPKKFMREQSYGKLKITGDVYGWYTLSENEPATCPLTNPPYKVLTDNNIDATQYNNIFMLIECDGVNTGSGYTPANSYNGISNIGIINSNILSKWGDNYPFDWTVLDRMIVHELGHSLGKYYGGNIAQHSHGLDCGNGLPFLLNDGCTTQEYGNYYDQLGLGTLANHFNGYVKNWFGWIADDDVITIEKNGIYTIRPIEEKGAKIARIKIGEYYPYYLEFRMPFGFDRSIPESGLYANYVAYQSSNTNMASDYLLDFKPSKTSWDTNVRSVSLINGEKYYDTYNDLTIGPVKIQKQSGENNYALSFYVNFGEQYHCDLPPYLYMKSSSVSGDVIKLSYGIYNNNSFYCDNNSYTFNVDFPDSFTLSGMQNPSIPSVRPRFTWNSGTYNIEFPNNISGIYNIIATATSTIYPEATSTVNYQLNTLGQN